MSQHIRFTIRTLVCGRATPAGLASLCLTAWAVAVPPNNHCQDAIEITQFQYANTQDLTGANVQIDPYLISCGSFQEPVHNDVWYKFVAPGDGFITVRANASTGDAVLGAWPATCGEVALGGGCDSQSAGHDAVVQDIWVNSGWQHRIQLSLASQPSGPASAFLQFFYHPLVYNDTCATARQINANEYVDSMDVYAAHGESCDAQPTCLGQFIPQNRTVWYQFTAPIGGIAIIHTEGSTYDTAIALYSGCPIQSAQFGCLEPAQLACANDAGENGALMLQSMTEGQSYLIKVAQVGNVPDDEWDGYNLNFHFGFIPTGAPLNDVCANATLITSDQFNPPPLLITHAGSTNNEPQENCESGGFGVSNTVFYRFVPSEDGYATINTFGSSYDSVLSVFNGCGTMLLPPQGYAQPTLLACDNDAGGIFGATSAISNVSMQAGETYIIKVAGNGPTSDSGSLDFNFQFEPQPLCPADVTNNGVVNIEDLLAVIAAWGAPGASSADVNDDNIVNIADLLAVIAAWGACP